MLLILSLASFTTIVTKMSKIIILSRLEQKGVLIIYFPDIEM